MKRFSFLFIVTLLTSVLFAQEAEITFDKDSHDFGTIAEELGKVSYDFTFTNTGKAPLFLTRVSASCGCTTPNWTKEPIAPGEKGKITVTYSTTGRPGSFNKSITVISNAQNSTNKVLRISGVVTPKNTATTPQPNFQNQDTSIFTEGFQISSNKLTFELAPRSKKLQYINIENKGDSPLSVKIDKTPKYVTVVSSMATIPAKTTGVVTVTFDAAKITKADTYNGQFVIELTDNKNNKTTKNKITVNAVVK